MRSAVLLFTLLSAAAPALAQPSPDPAEAAYQEGRRLYDVQEWDNAIAKFKEAYAARSDAASLFNIAQSYRLKGDCAHASSFYKTYKRNFPAAPNIAKVDKFIADLEACAAAAPAVTEPVKPVDPVVTEPVKPVEPIKPVVTEPVKPVVVTQPPRDDDPGHGKRLAGIGVGIAGVAFVGIGIFYGIQASHKSSTVMNNPVGTTWDPSLESDGTKDNQRAVIFDVVGAAALVTGGVLYFLGRRHSTESGISLAPRRDGAMLSWSCGL